MSLETRGSEHITTHHIITVWTAEYLIHCDTEDEAAYAPRMHISSDKTTRHHNPDDKHLKIHHHKKCVAIFMFSAGTKIVYESRYMFGSPLNLITEKKIDLPSSKYFATFSEIYYLFLIGDLVLYSGETRWAYLIFLRG